MSPTKPERLLAIESACIAQSRLADAVTGLAAFESPDLEGALRELGEALSRVKEARLAIRRAIVERDGCATFPAGTNAELVTRDDAGAQRVMADRHNACADELESDEVQKWSAA